jgi:Rho GTPase-activating protein RGD1
MNFQTLHEQERQSPGFGPGQSSPNPSLQAPQLPLQYPTYSSLEATNLNPPETSSVQQTPTPTSTTFNVPSLAALTPPQERSSPPPPNVGPSRQRETASTPSTPKGFTFGTPLDMLIAMQNATLPLIVAQCISAIDQFGVTAEGIYRKSGSASTLAKLKQLFDFEPELVDFRTEAGFYGDIHAVAGILKQFLRDLPEPLLTRGFYSEFIRVSSTSFSETF